MKAKYQIGLKKRGTGTEDAHGNVTDTYGNAVIYKVYAIAPNNSDEPDQRGVITGLKILAPSDVPAEYRDIVVIDGKDYTVEGEVGDYTKGPFKYAPGIEINVRRVEG